MFLDRVVLNRVRVLTKATSTWTDQQVTTEIMASVAAGSAQPQTLTTMI